MLRIPEMLDPLVYVVPVQMFDRYLAIAQIANAEAGAVLAPPVFALVGGGNFTIHDAVKPDDLMQATCLSGDALFAASAQPCAVRSSTGRTRGGGRLHGLVWFPRNEEAHPRLHTEDQQQVAPILSAIGPESVVIKPCCPRQSRLRGGNRPNGRGCHLTRLRLGQHRCRRLQRCIGGNAPVDVRPGTGNRRDCRRISCYGISALLTTSANGAARRLAAWR